MNSINWNTKLVFGNLLLGRINSLIRLQTKCRLQNDQPFYGRSDLKKTTGSIKFSFLLFAPQNSQCVRLFVFVLVIVTRSWAADARSTRNEYWFFFFVFMLIFSHCFKSFFSLERTVNETHIYRGETHVHAQSPKRKENKKYNVH